MKTHALIALASACLLMACSGKPSSGDAEDALQNRLQKSESSIEVKSFKASKAYTQDVMGTQVHVVEYEAEIAYPNGLNAECKSNPLEGKCMQVLAFGHQVIEPGTVQQKAGKVEFQKTSEGWKGPDGNFY